MAQSKQITTSDEPSKCNKIRRSSDEMHKHLFETGKWSDLTVTLNSKDYLIHKVIVCPAIPFFGSMISNNLSESHENRVTIKHPIENNAFEWLIQWAYSYEKEINFKNVGDLLVASDYLQVEKVFDACCVYLDEILNVETALSIKEWISPFNVGELNNKVTFYILENFKAISKTEKWLSLSVECLTKYMQDGDAVGFDEYEIVEAILDWAEFVPDTRQEHLSSLLGLIIWHDIEPTYIFEELVPCELIKKDKACRKLLMDVLEFKAFPDSNNPLAPYWKSMRVHRYKGEALMAFDSSSHYLNCWVLTPYSKEWSSWGSSKNSKIYQAERLQITATDEFLYFHTEKDGSSSNFFVNLLWGTCHEDKTIYPKTVTSSRDKIYIAESSNDSHEIIKFISTGDLQKSDWYELFVSPNLPDAGMAYLNGYLYCIGVIHDYSESTLVLNSRYNILESKWNILPSMSTPRFNPKVITLDDKIYVYGGTKARYGNRAQITVKSIECYDPKKEKWFDLPKLESHIEFLVPFNSKLYAFSDRKLKSVNIYDPKTNTWNQEMKPGFEKDMISVIFIPNVQTL